MAIRLRRNTRAVTPASTGAAAPGYVCEKPTTFITVLPLLRTPSSGPGSGSVIGGPAGARGPPPPRAAARSPAALKPPVDGSSATTSGRRALNAAKLPS